MKLNRKDKNELRFYIIEKLRNFSSDNRLKLDKELLEELLFEVVTIDEEKDIKIKIPVWFGIQICSLDLSEVDFTNVSWATLDTLIKENVRIDKKTYDFICNCYGKSNRYIGYYNTNANIDLSKSFEAIHLSKVILEKCSFSLTDLSNNKLSNISEVHIIDSDISETGLKIPTSVELNVINSNLRGVDLSSKEINGYGFIVFPKNSSLCGCNLIDTHINIIIDNKDFPDKEQKRILKSTMEFYWQGCYINGVYYDTRHGNQKSNHKNEIKEEYEKMKRAAFNSIDESVKKQVKELKKQ